MLLTASDNEQIKSAVVRGNRPALNVITGPDDLVSFATHWISLCWHQSPQQRPSFHGTYNMYIVLSLCLLLFISCRYPSSGRNKLSCFALEFCRPLRVSVRSFLAFTRWHLLLRYCCCCCYLLVACFIVVRQVSLS